MCVEINVRINDDCEEIINLLIYPQTSSFVYIKCGREHRETAACIRVHLKGERKIRKTFFALSRVKFF
jgi:hypothetical protein